MIDQQQLDSVGKMGGDFYSLTTNLSILNSFFSMLSISSLELALYFLSSTNSQSGANLPLALNLLKTLSAISKVWGDLLCKYVTTSNMF